MKVMIGVWVGGDCGDYDGSDCDYEGDYDYGGGDDNDGVDEGDYEGDDCDYNGGDDGDYDGGDDGDDDYDGGDVGDYDGDDGDYDGVDDSVVIITVMMMRMKKVAKIDMEKC